MGAELVIEAEMIALPEEINIMVRQETDPGTYGFLLSYRFLNLSRCHAPSILIL